MQQWDDAQANTGLECEIGTIYALTKAEGTTNEARQISASWRSAE
jgi:hypothetical protein